MVRAGMVSVRIVVPMVWVLDETDEVGGILGVMGACPLPLGTRWVT